VCGPICRLVHPDPHEALLARKIHVVIACGGTGGHLFPGIAVAEELRVRGHEAMLLISKKKVDREGTEKYGELRFEEVEAIAKPATFSPKMVPFIWKLLRTTLGCRKLLKGLGADAVLGMGGFTSLPPVFAGHRLGMKAFVHDSNALPGKANRLTARWCDMVLVGLEAAVAHFGGRPTVVTGTPVRKELEKLPAREDAAAAFGLDPKRPVLLVMGGSQGARRLNRMTPAAVALLKTEAQVLHIAGGREEPEVRTQAGARAGYHVIGFCDRMADAYAVADLVISRAGASSLTELAHAGLPSILVPYPYAADDHQTRNGEVFAQAGAAEMVQDADLDENKLAEMIDGILGDLPRRERMAQAARGLAVPDAAARVAGVIEKCCEMEE